MKKFLSMFLALVMLASLALGSVAIAEEAAAKTSATAWLLYFASGHATDSANFPWWPQHQRVDQPASETGVEATNAEVTGPGKYTVGLKFNWQKAEGAIQFNLILNDAETLFPGYYVDITDIRVNGASIEVGENLYGTYHDDPVSGMVSIYNSYWDPAFGGSGGPEGHRAFDGTPEDAGCLIINPDDIVNGDTIEVDFIVSDEAGKAPEELGAMPYTVMKANELPKVEEEPEEAPAPESTAWLLYFASNHEKDSNKFPWWPQHTSADHPASQTGVIAKNATVTGPGYYTTSLEFTWQKAEGAIQLNLILNDAEVNFPGYYVDITDIRVNGESIDVAENLYGKYHDNPTAGMVSIYNTYWDPAFQGSGGPDGHRAFDGTPDDATCLIINPDDIINGSTIEVDFLVSDQEGVLPEQQVVVAAPKYEYVWYPMNTAGVAGLSLKDLGIADDWHNIVPVDLTETGWQKFTLVGADAYVIGNAYVAVNNGAVTVKFDYIYPGAFPQTECVKWFTDLSQITAEELASTENGLTGADVVNIATDLGGADMAYLSINNKVTFRNPVDQTGATLTRYFRNNNHWKAYREELMAMLPTVEAEAETEAAAE